MNGLPGYRTYLYEFNIIFEIRLSAVQPRIRRGRYIRGTNRRKKKKTVLVVCRNLAAKKGPPTHTQTLLLRPDE